MNEALYSKRLRWLAICKTATGCCAEVAACRHSACDLIYTGRRFTKAEG
jgi:hypothetical protein